MDLILGLPRSKTGYDVLVIFVCQLTRMAHFVPVHQTIGANGLGHALVMEVVRLHGVPGAIISDRGSRFTSEIRKGMCERLNITLQTSTAYHPQTDGLAERTNQTTEQMVRCTILGNEYERAEVLPMLEFAYNSSIRSSTRASPFEMLYGFVPSKPICQKYGLPMTVPARPLQAEICLRKANMELEKAKSLNSVLLTLGEFSGVSSWGQSVVEGLTSALGNYNFFKSFGYGGPFTITSKVGEQACRFKLPPSMLTHPVFHVSLL